MMGTRLLVSFLGLIVPHAFADATPCQPGWEWAFNSFQQTPCEVADLLQAGCRGLSATSSSRDTEPRVGEICDCNTVMFSLRMACAACQDLPTQLWSHWSQNCTQVDITRYPEVIPQNTAIPYWAYLNYTIGGRFDPGVAKLAGDQPEGFAAGPSIVSPPDNFTASDPAPPRSTSAGSIGAPARGDQQSDGQPTTPDPLGSLQGGAVGSTLENPTSTPTAGDRQGDQVGKRSPKVALIIGGVLGVLAFVVVVGFVAWRFRRARKISGGVERALPGGRGSSWVVLTSEHGMQATRPRSCTDYTVSNGCTSPTSTLGRYAGTAEL